MFPIIFQIYPVFLYSHSFSLRVPCLIKFLLATFSTIPCSLRYFALFHCSPKPLRDPPYWRLRVNPRVDLFLDQVSREFLRHNSQITKQKRAITLAADPRRRDNSFAGRHNNSTREKVDVDHRFLLLGSWRGDVYKLELATHAFRSLSNSKHMSTARISKTA